MPPLLERQATEAAAAAGLRPIVRLLGGPEDVAPALDAFRDDGAQALLVFEVPRTSTHAAVIAARAHAAGLPTLFGADLARVSPMLACGTSLAGASRRMARLVARILGGERPGDLPVETVAETELVVDLGVARRLGVRVPDEVLAQASRIVG